MIVKWMEYRTSWENKLIATALDDTSINSAIRTKFESVLCDIGSNSSHLDPNIPSVTSADPIDPLTKWMRESRSRKSSLKNENGTIMSLLRQHFETLQQRHQHQDMTTPFKGGFLDNFNKAKKAVQGSIQEMKHVKNEMMEEASKNTTLMFTLPQKAIANGTGKTAMTTPKRWKDGSNALHLGLERNLKLIAGRITNNQTNLDGLNEDEDDWLSSRALFKKTRRESMPVFRGIPTWRQDIYTLVTTPIKKSTEEPVGAVGYDNVLEIPMDFADLSPLDVTENDEKSAKISKRDYKALWKRAILDQILLIRMEKANSTLKGCFLLHVGTRAMVLFPSTSSGEACQDWVAHRRCKLDFDDSIGGLRCPEELGEVWQDLLNEQSVDSVKYDYVFAAVKSGIPKLIRGEAWKFLREFNMKRLRQSHGCRETEDGQTVDTNCNVIKNDSIVTPLSTLEFHYNYESLIRKKSKHQNDIFLDLDRTFPTHPFFAEKYGIGQLALYNVLRAYSIVDDDVGYCQGMSFVASVLLMHLTEEESFEMLRYMMQALNLRRQYRPPNMTGLQVKQYQLQRLLHDRLPKLHSHLQKLEIPPTLYATAWFLTLFSSQFPLGLVIRLFDLILLDGPDVVFKVAVVIFTKFESEIMSQMAFESVINVFKNKLPRLVELHASEIIKAIFDNSWEYLSKQLFAYEVEYQVMREEEIINSPTPSVSAPSSAFPQPHMSRSDTSNDMRPDSLLLGPPGVNAGGTMTSLQKHNELCLEKVAALNKKLEREKYALELKSQQLKQHSYDLQDQVASMQREECKLHSAIMLLVQERHMLINTLSHLSSHDSPQSPHLPREVTLNDLQLCNLEDILPEKLLKNFSMNQSVNDMPLNHSSQASLNSSKSNFLSPNGNVR